MRRIAISVLVLALLGGTTAAFALTQALKLRRSPVTAPRFDERFAPTCGCPSNEAQLALRLREADRVDAVVVDSSGEPVRSLAAGLERAKGVIRFSWDGRNEQGALVPDGKYRLRIHLEERRRTIVIPNTVAVDATKPAARMIGVNRSVFSPDGDGRGDQIRVRYHASERSQAVLLANGVAAARTQFAKAGTGTIAWRGQIEGKRLSPGFLRLSVQLTDEAGNVSEPSPAVRVRVRYLELEGGQLDVVEGGTLRIAVESDARSFRWTLRRRAVFPPRRKIVLRGIVRGREAFVRLPPRVQPGRYVLRVTANGFADRARVVVGRRSR